MRYCYSAYRQTINAIELNSKFDKTSNFIEKPYHNLISEEIHCLFV